MLPTPKHLPTPALAPVAGAGVARIAAGVLLGGLLFGATIWNSELYAALDAGWQWVFAAVGLSRYAPRLLQQGSGVGQLMHHPHSVPAVLSFGVLYIGVCVALQLILLPQASQRRLVGWFYGSACVMALGLLLAGKRGGSTALAELDRQLVHFLISPLPVIVLVPLLKWYMPAALPGREASE